MASLQEITISKLSKSAASDEREQIEKICDSIQEYLDHKYGNLISSTGHQSSSPEDWGLVDEVRRQLSLQSTHLAYSAILYKAKKKVDEFYETLSENCEFRLLCGSEGTVDSENSVLFEQFQSNSAVLSENVCVKSLLDSDQSNIIYVGFITEQYNEGDLLSVQQKHYGKYLNLWVCDRNDEKLFDKQLRDRLVTSQWKLHGDATNNIESSFCPYIDSHFHPATFLESLSYENEFDGLSLKIPLHAFDKSMITECPVRDSKDLGIWFSVDWQEGLELPNFEKNLIAIRECSEQSNAEFLGLTVTRESESGSNQLVLLPELQDRDKRALYRHNLLRISRVLNEKGGTVGEIPEFGSQRGWVYRRDPEDRRLGLLEIIGLVGRTVDVKGSYIRRNSLRHDSNEKAYHDSDFDFRVVDFSPTDRAVSLDNNSGAIWKVFAQQYLIGERCVTKQDICCLLGNLDVSGISEKLDIENLTTMLRLGRDSSSGALSPYVNVIMQAKEEWVDEIDLTERERMQRILDHVLNIYTTPSENYEVEILLRN